MDPVSLRDYFAAAALQNSTLCTGEAVPWQLKAWFGDRYEITREEIAAAQADSYADAMLARRPMLARHPK